ncbi:MAG: hypothetical protein DCE86_02690 [Flavobacteriaceae bacterium]|nr:MAG: hypothetical protein DCE86_02690 [Flavobacteriaceae bacterium]
MKKAFLFLVFCLFSTALSAQKQGQMLIDSLETALKNTKDKKSIVIIKNKLSQEYSRVDPEKGKQLAKSAIEMAETIDFKNGLAEGYRCLGINTTDSTAINFYRKGLAFAKETKDKQVLSVLYRNIAVYYIYRNDYKNGLDYSFKSLKLSEELGKNEEIAGTYINIGFIYNDLKDRKKALEYFKKALDINKKFNNPTMKAVILENIGVLYNNEGKNELAVSYLNQALEINRKNNNLNFVATNLGTLGSAYLELKKYDLAESHIKEALKISKELKIRRVMSYNLQNLSMIYMDKYADPKNNSFYKSRPVADTSLLMLKEAVIYDQESNDIKSLSTDFKQIASLYEELGDSKNALLYFKKFNTYKDSIYQTDTKETVKNLEDQRTIELKNKEIQFNKLKIESKEKQKWYFILGLILLGIIGILLFYQSRNRKRSNEKLQQLNNELDLANKTKSRFFSILNHDLRSPVSSLIHFLHLQKENPELLDAESKKRMEDKTINSAENLLNSMEDLLLWSKGQMENFKPQPKTISVGSLFEDTRKHFSGQEKIDILFEDPQGLILNTDENYLKTIIRNLTGNAIKALEKTNNAKIIWKAWQENGIKHLSITDNGPGGTQEQFKALYDDKEVVGIKTGLGLHLIRDLAKAIDCKIDIQTQPNQGTAFILTLK